MAIKKKKFKTRLLLVGLSLMVLGVLVWVLLTFTNLSPNKRAGAIKGCKRCFGAICQDYTGKVSNCSPALNECSASADCVKQSKTLITSPTPDKAVKQDPPYYPPDF